MRAHDLFQLVFSALQFQPRAFSTSIVRSVQATQAFTRTVQLDATHGEAWNNLGILHLRAARHRAAYTALSVALQHKGDHWQARFWTSSGLMQQ